MRKISGNKGSHREENKPNVLAIAAVIVFAVLCLAGIVFISNHSSVLSGRLPVSYGDQLGRPKESESPQTSEEEEPEQYEPGEPYGSPTGEETVDWESTAHLSTGEEFTYKNGKVLTYNYRNDEVISAGIAEIDASEGIYLDLHCSAAHEGNKIGYYVTARTGLVEYSRGYVGPVNSSTNIGSTDFVIVDRLYSKVRGTKYHDPVDFGMRWRNTGIYDDAETTAIGVRAVNLVTGSLLCIFDINIAYDSESHTFSLESISPADVCYSNELSEEVRSQTIEKAVDFVDGSMELSLDDVDWASLGLDPDYDWKASLRNNATVDKVAKPYFNLFLDTSGKTANFFQDYPACSDIFAVTMPVSLYGYITVYLAPWYEIHHMTQEYTGEGELQRLEIIGYDPLLPRSSQTIVVPQDGNWEKYTNENYPSF